MDRLFRQVSVKDRLPEKEGKYHTNVGLVYFHGKEFYHWIEWWLEEITLESIQDKRELTATFLVNSIRLLDEQGARHLVKELCERFHLLPSEEILDAIDYNGGFKDGVKWIIDKLKGTKK